MVLGHLHFDHAGGLHEVPGCDVHVHRAEVEAFATGDYKGVFPDEVLEKDSWRFQSGDYLIAPGVHAVCTPGHTAGHMSLVVELDKGRPVVICGDAADLQENLTDEIAPGYCWQDNENLALESIRKLKSIEREERAELWPNHDLEFFEALPRFPTARE